MDNNYNGSRWQKSKDKLVLSKENRPWHNLRRSVFIYITWIRLQAQFLLLQYFFLNSLMLILSVFFFFYTVSLLSSPSFTCRSDHWCWSLSHQNLPKVFESSCKTENYYSYITSSLMWSESYLQSIQCSSDSFLLDIS